MKQVPRVLIEEWLPAAANGVECIRERSTGQQPPDKRLHVWWARRPLVAARAAVLASLLPADFPREVFERATRGKIHAELQRVLAGHDPFWPRRVVNGEKHSASRSRSGSPRRPNRHASTGGAAAPATSGSESTPTPRGRGTTGSVLAAAAWGFDDLWRDEHPDVHTVPLPEALLQQLREFRRGLTDNQRRGRLLGREIDAALDDPRWAAQAASGGGRTNPDNQEER